MVSNTVVPILRSIYFSVVGFCPLLSCHLVSKPTCVWPVTAHPTDVAVATHYLLYILVTPLCISNHTAVHYVLHTYRPSRLSPCLSWVVVANPLSSALPRLSWPIYPILLFFHAGDKSRELTCTCTVSGKKRLKASPPTRCAQNHCRNPLCVARASQDMSFKAE